MFAVIENNTLHGGKGEDINDLASSVVVCGPHVYVMFNDSSILLAFWEAC